MPSLRIQKQRNVFNEYFTEHNMIQSFKAMELVDKYHIGIRKDGNPESSHLYEVAGQIISFLSMRVNDYTLDCVVSASFLHDLIEDYDYKFNEKDLYNTFDELTSNLTMNVCKWNGFSKTEDNYKIYYNNVNKHYLSVFIKVSDRIHNLDSCLGAMSNERIIEYINETEKYIIPLLKGVRDSENGLYMIIVCINNQLLYRLKMLKLILQMS